jgi:hypothetical protein
LGWRRHSSTSILRSASEHLFSTHRPLWWPAWNPSPLSWWHPPCRPSLLLRVTSLACAWGLRTGRWSGALEKDEGLNDYFNRTGSTTISLDLNLEAAATERQRKTKGQSSESTSARVNLSHCTVK